jgi:hypothetical protein
LLVELREIEAVRNQAAVHRKDAEGIDCRQAMASGKAGDAIAVYHGKAVGENNYSSVSNLGYFFDCLARPNHFSDSA